MKNQVFFTFFTLLCIVVSFSCSNDANTIQENVEIRFMNRSGDFICGEFCGTTINVVGGENDLKSKYELPDSISSKPEYWNRDYIATLEFLDENCNCKVDGDPIPEPDWQFPTRDLKMVEILSIREK